MKYKNLKLIAFNERADEPTAFWVTAMIPERDLSIDQLIDYIVRPMVDCVAEKMGAYDAPHNKMACEHDYGKYSIDNGASPLDPPKQHSWIKCIKCGAPA